MKGGDDGFGLLETLVAMVILGVAVVIIAGGMGTSILASNRHREQAAGNAVLLAASENVRSDSVPHVVCAMPATATGYLTAARNVDLPTGWSASDIAITTITYYDGTGYTATCHDDPADRFPLALQLITLQVADPAGRTTERLSFVKATP